MADVTVREIFRHPEEFADKEIQVKGWVRTNRGSNKFGFVELNDGTFFKSIQEIGRAHV